MNQAIDAAKLQDLAIYFENILNALIPLFGIIAFIMLLVGGFTILTSSGNPEAQEKGKKTITYAVLGIILAIGSWLILSTIQRITGVSVTNFTFGF